MEQNNDIYYDFSLIFMKSTKILTLDKLYLDKKVLSFIISFVFLGFLEIWRKREYILRFIYH